MFGFTSKLNNQQFAMIYKGLVPQKAPNVCFEHLFNDKHKTNGFSGIHRKTQKACSESVARGPVGKLAVAMLVLLARLFGFLLFVWLLC